MDGKVPPRHGGKEIVRIERARRGSRTSGSRHVVLEVASRLDRIIA
jgi:hypothetical protein